MRPSGVSTGTNPNLTQGEMPRAGAAREPIAAGPPGASPHNASRPESRAGGTETRGPEMPAVYVHDAIAVAIIIVIVGIFAIRQFTRACHACRSGGPAVQRGCQHCANQARHDSHMRAVTHKSTR
jgi:hypothetical protein